MFAAGLVILLISSFFSLKIGAFSFSSTQIITDLFSNSESESAIILQDVRMPRLLITMITGANLAVAGALIQALMRNPLASPSVLGINAGASLTVVSCLVFFPAITGYWLIITGFIGATVAALLIFIMSVVFRGGNIAVSISLVGIAIQAFFSSATQSILIFNEESIKTILIWLAGMTAGSTWDDVYLLLPLSLLVYFFAFCSHRSLTILLLGEEVAINLGQRLVAIKLYVSILVILLAGATVSIVGPIGFVGLIIPHIVRYLAGQDYKWLLPLSALYGGCLLVVADILSRFIMFPAETPVGILTALLGSVYFVYLSRTKKMKEKS
ncbi:FecCD family ABC transporter permease [Niallia sp. FSL R7-0271]|uniref:FecCD family ABC transporter permease n=1 Tax=Niallia sp. FSL R7-0271 TaxID=2921678 RepID=UPI0030F6D2E2